LSAGRLWGFACGNQADESEIFQSLGDVSFFYRQSRVALRNSGLIIPEDIYEYVYYDGFKLYRGF
jgi:hypothetical protein